MTTSAPSNWYKRGLIHHYHIGSLQFDLRWDQHVITTWAPFNFYKGRLTRHCLVDSLQFISKGINTPLPHRLRLFFKKSNFLEMFIFLVDVAISVAAVPDAPHSVVAKDVSKSEATVTWQPPSNDGGVPVEGYHVERCSDSSERWVRQTRSPLRDTTYTADNLMEGTEYMYRIVAVNKRGESSPSQPTEAFIAKLPYGNICTSLLYGCTWW